MRLILLFINNNMYADLIFTDTVAGSSVSRFIGALYSVTGSFWAILAGFLIVRQRMNLAFKLPITCFLLLSLVLSCVDCYSSAKLLYPFSFVCNKIAVTLLLTSTGFLSDSEELIGGRKLTLTAMMVASWTFVLSLSGVLFAWRADSVVLSETAQKVVHVIALLLEIMLLVYAVLQRRAQLVLSWLIIAYCILETAREFGVTASAIASDAGTDKTVYRIIGWAGDALFVGIATGYLMYHHK